jgi:Transglycosylase-like domain
MRTDTKFRIAAVVAAGTISVPTVLAAGSPHVPSTLSAPLAGNRTMAAEMRAGARYRLLRSHEKLLRRLASARGEKLDAHAMPHARRWSNERLRRSNVTLRRILRSGVVAPAVPIPGALASIANCESHGNPSAIGGGGLYRGKYQMTYTTWASVGGAGDPAAAPEAEQDRRAAMLLARSGTSQWPVCG